MCFSSEDSAEAFIEKMKPVKTDKRGSLYTLTINGTEADIQKELSAADTVFAEVLPLSLEEIFISETEVKGYDVRSLIM